jgi:uncharacterized membrane protein YkgB
MMRYPVARGDDYERSNRGEIVACPLKRVHHSLGLLSGEVSVTIWRIAVDFLATVVSAWVFAEDVVSGRVRDLLLRADHLLVAATCAGRR